MLFEQKLGKGILWTKQSMKISILGDVNLIFINKKTRISITSLKEQPKDIFENIAIFQPKVTGKDVVIFTRQLSTMIDAGLPLVQCLEILGNQQENPTFKKMLNEVRMDVETGTTFADAMKKHYKAFDTLYCNMVEAGEVGGILDTILRRSRDVIFC